MNTNGLRIIRATVLNDLHKFIPPGYFKPIYSKSKFYINDLDLIQRLTMKQTVKPGDISPRQLAAIHLLEGIYEFMEAKDDELKNTDTDFDGKDFINFINNKLHFLKEAIKTYANCLPPDEEKIFLKHCDELFTTESIDLTKKETGEVESTEKDLQKELKSEEPPGKAPWNAVGKLAVKAAWELELLHDKKASAKGVMSMLQDWADNGKYPDTLLKSNKLNKSVLWSTGKCIEKNFSLEACGKILKDWYKSRE